MKDLKVIFMGTPEFSVPVLEKLLENTQVVLVVTQPDKPVGRKHVLTPSPVKKIAMENNIPVFQPEKIRKDFEQVLQTPCDILITCAYGQIIPKEVLDLPKRGCVNVHASILPKYRGSAPIQWAIMNGDAKTGVTIMYMDEGMDTGDIIKSAEIPILDTDNVGTMNKKLSILGRDTLKSVLNNILNGIVIGIKQTDDFTMAPQIKREDEKINFNNNGINIINKIRALNPWPLANIVIDNKEIKVIEAEFKECSSKGVGKIAEITKNSFGISCKDGIIYLKKVKPFGKKEMNINSFINGINVDDYLNKVVE